MRQHLFINGPFYLLGGAVIGLVVLVWALAHQDKVRAREVAISTSSACQKSPPAPPEFTPVQRLAYLVASDPHSSLLVLGVCSYVAIVLLEENRRSVALRCRVHLPPNIQKSTPANKAKQGEGDLLGAGDLADHRKSDDGRKAAN